MSQFNVRDIIAGIIAIYQLCVPLVVALIIAGALAAVLFNYLFK